MINKNFQVYHPNGKLSLGDWIKKQSDNFLFCREYEDCYSWGCYNMWNDYTTYKELEKYIND